MEFNYQISPVIKSFFSYWAFFQIGFFNQVFPKIQSALRIYIFSKVEIFLNTVSVIFSVHLLSLLFSNCLLAMFSEWSNCSQNSG